MPAIHEVRTLLESIRVLAPMLDDTEFNTIMIVLAKAVDRLEKEGRVTDDW